MSKAARDNRANQLNPNSSAYRSSRSSPSTKDHTNTPASNQGRGSWRTRMDARSASRIQSHADKSGKNQDFKSRAQAAADKNEKGESDS